MMDKPNIFAMKEQNNEISTVYSFDILDYLQ